MEEPETLLILKRHNLEQDVHVNNNEIQQQDVNGVEEEQEGLRQITFSCYECKAEIGTFARKKKRRMLCQECRGEKRKERNGENPMRVLTQRLRSSLSAKRIKVPNTVDLDDLTRRVYNRWEKKSVLSGETDVSKLCITGFKRLQEGQMPDENELVLVTSAEAIALARHKTQDGRMGRFSLEVKGHVYNKTNPQNDNNK